MNNVLTFTRGQSAIVLVFHTNDQAIVKRNRMMDIAQWGIKWVKKLHA